MVGLGNIFALLLDAIPRCVAKVEGWAIPSAPASNVPVFAVPVPLRPQLSVPGQLRCISHTAVGGIYSRTVDWPPSKWKASVVFCCLLDEIHSHSLASETFGELVLNPVSKCLAHYNCSCTKLDQSPCAFPLESRLHIQVLPGLQPTHKCLDLCVPLCVSHFRYKAWRSSLLSWLPIMHSSSGDCIPSLRGGSLPCPSSLPVTGVSTRCISDNQTILSPGLLQWLVGDCHMTPVWPVRFHSWSLAGAFGKKADGELISLQPGTACHRLWKLAWEWNWDGEKRGQEHILKKEFKSWIQPGLGGDPPLEFPRNGIQ